MLKNQNYIRQTCIKPGSKSSQETGESQVRGCENWQPEKIHRLQKFAGYEISQPAKFSGCQIL